jgi:hypothetical protein
MTDTPERETDSDISAIEVRAPKSGELVRVNADPEKRTEATLLRDEDGTLYLVAEAVVDDLSRRGIKDERLERTMLFLACNGDGVNFLWPVRTPVPEDHPAYLAMKGWMRAPVTH